MALKLVLNNPAPKLIGLAVVAKIREKTLKGLDKDGKPFRSYSTNPITIPASETTQSAISRLASQKQLSLFEKSGESFLYIEGGYLELKKAKRPGDGGKVNLTDTGQMLRSLTVVRADADKIQIGFTNLEQARKMVDNQELGRDPMGLTFAEMREISEKVISSNNYIDLVDF